MHRFKKTIALIIAMLVVVKCPTFAHVVDTDPNETPKLRNPVDIVISPDGSRAVVVCHDNSIAVINLQSGNYEVDNIPAGSWPGEHPRRAVFIGTNCFVINEYSEFITEFDPVTMNIVANHSVPKYCQDMIQDGIQNFIFITNRWLDEVLVYDESFNPVMVPGIKVGRNPDALSFDNEQDKLYVGNAGTWDISVIDRASLQVIHTIYLGSAPTALIKVGNSIAATNHGGRNLSKVNGAPLIQNDQIDIINVVTMIDQTSGSLVDFFTDSGADYAGLDERAGLLAFTGSGSGTVHLWRTNLPQIAMQTIDILSDPWNLPGGRAPSGLRIFTNTRSVAVKDAQTVYCANYLRDTVVEIRFNNGQNLFEVTREIPLNSLGVPITAFQPDRVNFNQRQNGERYFSTIAAWRRDQTDFTCATCHPNGHSDFRFIFDSNPDPFNPSMAQGPEKHPSAISTNLTAPFAWEASAPDLEAFNQIALNSHDVQNGSNIIHNDVAKFLVKFEELLRPEPNPFPGPNGDPQNPNAAERGKLVFGQAKCGNCHFDVAFTDNKTYEIGTGRTLDTPSLQGLWDKAPYLHDGRAATLLDVLAPDNYDRPDAHGNISKLDQQQKDDLVAYLLSIGENDIPLPVELVSFNAVVEGREVRLNWTTATEINNYGFTVQRKARRESEWQEVGFVRGNGTVFSAREYAFVDRIDTDGTFQYRLKQLDTGGSFEFSQIITITIGAPVEFTLMQNYPNPFNPETTIQYQIPRPAGDSSSQPQTSLKVFNLIGEQVRELVNEKQFPGFYTIKWDGRNELGAPVPSGVYVYRLRSGDFAETKKMLLAK